MSRAYSIVGQRSWANTSMLWTNKRQQWSTRPYWSTLVQPYPAGCTIYDDSLISISGLPVSVYDKLKIKRFEFADGLVSVDPNNLPPLAYIIGKLDLESDTSDYSILEGDEYINLPALFEKKSNPAIKDPNKFWIEDIRYINIPLFRIISPSNDRQKIIYGDFANFSQTQKFTVIKMAWAPLSVLQSEAGPILAAGFFNPNELDTGQQLYQQ
jgi:hypothetical protein